MTSETVFRLLFLILALVFIGIGNRYRWQAAQRQHAKIIRERWSSWLFGGLTIIVSWFFSAGYLLAPGWPTWAYCPAYPLWLRAMGALLIAVGAGLLAWAHRHLGQNYHSLVALYSEQTLVITGPYRWIRHPIYVASFLFDVGCGFLSANLVLTLAVPILLVTHVALRIDSEEQLLMERFGPAYRAYAHKTARFLPRFKVILRKDANSCI